MCQMDDPSTWPILGFLPVIKRSSGQTGFLVEGHGPKVFAGNLFDGGQIDLNNPQEVYANYQALSREWVID